MSDKEALKAAHTALVDSFGGWVSKAIAYEIIKAARPHILEAEAAKLDEQHRQWCIAKGRNPADYESKYRIAAAAIRAAKETGE